MNSADDRSELERLFELTYEDFRSLAYTYLADEAMQGTLQPTAVVHELFVNLSVRGEQQWRSRSHFFAVGATAMRRILVDHARKKMTDKRGGGYTRIELDQGLLLSAEQDEDVLALDDALRRLERINAVRARIVEMRFFAGMTLEEISEVMNISVSTIKRQWAATSSWLRAQLKESHKHEH